MRKQRLREIGSVGRPIIELDESDIIACAGVFRRNPS
jgi:hypothetical protein